jgi:hypothetical protein
MAEDAAGAAAGHRRAALTPERGGHMRAITILHHGSETRLTAAELFAKYNDITSH